MILMGAGTNHWFHSDTIYRGFLGADHADRLPGRQRRRLGALRRPGEVPPDHRLGAAGLRPGLEAAAAADDPHRVLVPAHRPVPLRPLRRRHGARRDRQRAAGRDSTADVIAKSARMGWMPSYPTFDRNPLDLADEAAAAGRPVAEHVVDQLTSGDLRFAAEDPDAPENFPRVLAIWRANLLGSSGKGNEYFLKHLLGTDGSLRAHEASGGHRPHEVEWHEDAPEGKLDLLLTLDFRQTSTTIFSDVVLPAATWYEKHDLNTTDMHPFIHSFNPAIAPAVADPHRLGRLADHRHQVQRAGGRPARRAHGRRRRAAAARHPGRDGQPARGGPRLEARRVRPGARGDDAQDRRGRARLHRGRGADAGARARCSTRSAPRPRA